MGFVYKWIPKALWIALSVWNQKYFNKFKEKKTIEKKLWDAPENFTIGL